MRDVKRRIRSRRYVADSNRDRPLFFTLFYRFIMIVMLVGVMSLAYVINSKMNFVQVPEWFEKQINNIGTWLPFESWFSKEVTPVIAPPTYQSLGNDMYKTGGNVAFSLQNGVVKYIDQQEASSCVAIVHDNGTSATYCDLATVEVHENDRVLKGGNFGTFTSQLQIKFVKDGKQVTLDEINKT